MPRSRFALALSAAMLSVGCARAGTPLSSPVVPAAADLPFDDAAIASVAETISDGQDARARLAMNRGSDAGVRSFAANLEADLPGGRIAMMQLGPRGSVIGDELANATDSAVRDLLRRRGGDFDRAFVAAEQTSLVTALHVLDGTLRPKAVAAELGRRLSHMRSVMAEELSRANALAGAMSATP